MRGIRNEIEEEIEAILSSDFKIDVTETKTVPHSSDAAITFPNLDTKTQGAKLLETTVLYIDMRRSTQLSLKHRRETVAKLYSSFVRSMTRCAAYFGGEVRGIIGDRVLVLFDPSKCFESAVDTAVLMNSVCQYLLNKYFVHNDVQFGIGIDYGSMLATKTGVRRHGAAQQSYRSLVWLGRPANVASKLTDKANKQRETADVTSVRVAYLSGQGLVYQDEYPHEFIRRFTHNPSSNLMIHNNPAFHSFTWSVKQIEMSPSTPPILMTESVYNGFRAARPNAAEIQNGWFTEVPLTIPDFSGKIFGGDVIYMVFREA